MKIDWRKVERTIGGLKFAVFVIALFALSMIIGTLLESYYGTEFANRVIYKTSWFMFIQFSIFLSIVFAATVRLPPKKRLYGFYTIHSGLIIIGIGSFVTFMAGVDGHLFLAPNETTRTVVLSKDILKITYPNDNKQFSYDLPYTAFEKKLDITQDEIHFNNYIPFGDGQLTWVDATKKYAPGEVTQSSRYLFKNAFAEQEFTLTLHPEAFSSDFQSTFSMGPLNVNYLPISIASCFEKENPSKIILWNMTNAECFTPEEKNIKINITGNNHRFIGIIFKGQKLAFFPDFSPYPLDKGLKANENSEIRVFSKKLFEGKPSLFLFGKKASFFDKNQNKWRTESLEVSGKPIILPWMNAQISLLQDETTRVPFNVPTATVPIQKNSQLIKGSLKAVSVDVLGTRYWVTSNNALELMIKGKKAIIELTKESITLPFEITLTKFKMDKDPGTNNPASYESFVKVFTGAGSATSHHVYMNNPLKMNEFTFYQASYSQDDQGNYSSTFSVNVDQGRPLKYLGSLMLVLGSIWHYNLNKKKIKLNKDEEAKEETV